MIGGRPDKNDAAPDALDKADLRAAYERGRLDERSARKSHPLLMTLTFVAALVGVALLALAGVHGSFAGAGGAVDQQLSAVAGRTGPAVREAADSAGESLHDAGQSVRAKTPG